MITIKFRGLRTDGKGWVYGMLFHNNKIVTETVSYESTLVEKGSPCYKYEYINIIPETVGQFTGLHDKNGKEIYEGDIVTDGVGKYKIVYDLKLAGYQPYCIFRDDPENYCEVIGNIYEDSHLLDNN